MDIYVVSYNCQIIGAFRNYNSAVNCIAEDQNVSSEEVIKEIEETGSYLDSYGIDTTNLED